MQTTQPTIRVSIDVGCHSHSVAVGLSDGQLIDEFDIDHNAQGFKLPPGSGLASCILGNFQL